MITGCGTTPDESVSAGAECAELVADQFPADAVLQLLDTERRDDGYVVGGKVSVPSMRIAGKYECELEHDADDDTWTLIRITVP